VSRVLAVVAFVVLAACTTDEPVEPSAPPAAAYRSETVDEGLGAVLRAVRTRGFSPEDTTYRGFVLDGSVAVHEVDLAAGSCYAVLAAGSTGLREIDLALYLSDGTEGTHAETVGARGALVYCPVHAGTYYLTLRASEGSGLYGARLARGPTGLDVTAADLLSTSSSER
jgi:hypothetical protein